MREWLRNFRMEGEITEAKIAELAHISQPFYHYIETGKKNPSVPVAKRIASVLGFSWTRFFDDLMREDGKEGKAS